MQEVSPMEDTKIYLLAELAVLPGFLEEVKAIFRRLLSRHSKNQVAKPDLSTDRQRRHRTSKS